MLTNSVEYRNDIEKSEIDNKEDFLFLYDHIISGINNNNKPNKLYMNNILSQNYSVYNDSIKNGDAVSINVKNDKQEWINKIIYNTYVTQAMYDGPCPVIVYTSANKDFIKNVMDNFSITIKDDSILHRHWLIGVNSTAAYIDSEIKKGTGFTESIDTYARTEENKKHMIYNCYLLFNVTYPDITSCKEAISTRLTLIEDCKQRLLKTTADLSDNGILFNFKNISPIETKKSIEEDINKIESFIKNLKDRLTIWEEYFLNKPSVERNLKFIPSVRKKAEERFHSVLTAEEKSFIDITMSFEDIKTIYDDKITEAEEKYKYELEILKLKLSFFLLLDDFKKYGLDIQKELHDSGTESIKRLLDTKVFNEEIWYAVHYYECRWLIGDFSLKDSLKGTVTKEVLDKRYHRLSMIAPLFAVNIYDMPKLFYAYVSEDKPYFPMSDFIDILIIDNTDSVPEEVYKCTFYLAKKAIILD